MKKLVLFLFTVLCATPAMAASESETQAQSFFENYVKLSQSFDAGIAKLYRANSEICVFRVSGSNSAPKKMCMPGTKWSEMITVGMPIAKAQNDVDDFKEVKYTLQQDGAVKITAKRYSSLKCATTPYQMLVTQDAEKNWFITKEYIVSQQQSSCK